MSKKITKILRSLQKAPERKHYLEFITAALSIPVLLTVILINLNSLNSSKKDVKENQSQPTPQTVIIQEKVGDTGKDSSESSVTITPTTSACKKTIGPVSISYPKEGARITDNPVNFIIKYDDLSYCSVVWSYRINGGSWSEYSSNSPSIYNLPNGDITFELRIQSTVSQDQDQIERKFTYQGTLISPSPIVTPTVVTSP
ncbi:MAG: hypothetical protein KBC00_03585 [Candidatus Levybacteria bacterium]|nr:hypothetical protein [Candidatus Levybacteria bacterium]MBP9815366.1 hypothetical protein [Candidatus Levybacteria bacterium]